MSRPQGTKNAQQKLATPDNIFFSTEERIKFLADLIATRIAEDEAEGRTVQGPGVPPGLDPKNPRWMSDDCIEPPAAPGK